MNRLPSREPEGSTDAGLAGLTCLLELQKLKACSLSFFFFLMHENSYPGVRDHPLLL